MRETRTHVHTCLCVTSSLALGVWLQPLAAMADDAVRDMCKLRARVRLFPCARVRYYGSR